MANLDLSKYGITGVTEILHNPSYDVLFAEETKPSLEGFEKGQVTELGAVNVMTGIYTGRSPKDKFFVKNEASAPYYGFGSHPVGDNGGNQRFGRSRFQGQSLMIEGDALYGHGVVVIVVVATGGCQRCCHKAEEKDS